MMGMLFLESLLALASFCVLVPAAVLFAELVAGTSKRPALDIVRRDADVRVVVLMPAHDEAEGIARSIDNVLAQLTPVDGLLVVADNCTDATASVARAGGARVIERDDPSRRGKGYALDFGVRSLEADPPDVVVVLDADCILAPDALARLVARCRDHAGPVQALYLMRTQAGASLGQRIAEFAWVVKNQARPLGAAALGWPCQLMGTGMAFPWALLRDAPLASGHLVEDMQLGLDLAARGAAPLFCADALVESHFPTDRDSVASQRTRWEHGHLSVIAASGPRLLLRALASGDGRLLAMTLDLMVPPLASLVMLTVLLIVVDAVAWAMGLGATPFAFAAGALCLIGVAVLVAWSRHARHVVGLRELAGLPAYVAAKIPVYARLVTKRQIDWIRTKRDGPGR